MTNNIVELSDQSDYSHNFGKINFVAFCFYCGVTKYILLMTNTLMGTFMFLSWLRSSSLIRGKQLKFVRIFTISIFSMMKNRPLINYK